MAINSSESDAVESRIAVEGIDGGTKEHSEEHEKLPNSSYHNIYSLRNTNSEAKENKIDLLDANESSDSYDKITKDVPALQREQLVSWNLGPGYQITQEWAKERAGDSSMLDGMSIFNLPVGVRPLEGSKEGLDISYAAEIPESKTEGVIKEQRHANSSITSLGALTDTGFLLVRDFYNKVFTMLKGKSADVPRKQGVISVRAASMLEAERDSPKKWNPVMEMQHRGGIYRGRCQGGLSDLSFYQFCMFIGALRHGTRAFS